MSEETKVEQEEKKYEIRSEKYPEARWYIIQTQSNCEKKVTQNLNEAVIRKEAEEKILEIFNPMIESTELKNGKKRKKLTKPFAGYVFVFAVMDSEVFNIIKQTERVVGFPSKNPARPLPYAMPNKEIEKVLDIIDGQKEKEENRFLFVEGVTVKVVDQTMAFSGMTGVVKSCNNARKEAKIEISIFGRPTEIDVPLQALEVYNED